MNTRTIFAAVAGVILVAGAFFYLRDEPPLDTPETSPDPAATHDTAAAPVERGLTAATSVPNDDAAPRDESSNLHSAPPLRANAPAPISDAPADMKFPSLPPPMLETEREFSAESIDAAWAKETETHVLDVIAQTTGLELVTLRVECRSTLCRLQIAQKELSRDNPFVALVDRIGLKPKWIIAGVDQNSVPTSLAYLQRE